LEDLCGQRLLAVDLNHGHLAAWVITPDGNPAGPPLTIPLQLDGLPTSQRDGRLRAAISQLLRTARENGCAAVAVEDLNFTDARARPPDQATQDRSGPPAEQQPRLLSVEER
jgi:hypothetical protein